MVQESKIKLANCGNPHVYNYMVSFVCYMHVTLVNMDLGIHMHKHVNTVHAVGGSSQHAT